MSQPYNLEFLYTVHNKIPDFSKKIFFFLKLVFFFKFFWKKFFKVELYICLFKSFTNRTCFKTKKNVFLIFKKKKKSYMITVYLKKGLILAVSIGNILKFFKIDSKYVKKTKKGFLMFLNIFIKIFNRFKPKFFYKSIIIHIFNFYLVFFLKKFKFLFEKRQDLKIFFNFNNHSLVKIKKNKSIKKRLTKKFLKNFLSHWSAINFFNNQEIRFKVK